MDFKTTLQLIILIALFLFVGFVLVVNAKNKKERTKPRFSANPEVEKKMIENEIANRKYLSKYSGRRKYTPAPPETNILTHKEEFERRKILKYSKLLKTNK